MSEATAQSIFLELVLFVLVIREPLWSSRRIALEKCRTRAGSRFDQAGNPRTRLLSCSLRLDDAGGGEAPVSSI